MKLLILCLSIFCTNLTFAQENSNIIKVFAMMTPNAGSFVATSDKARGRLLKTGDEFKADRLSVMVDSFKTENSLRDKHLAEYMGGGSSLPHPRIDIINLTGKQNKARATIVINGVSKELSLDYTEQSNYVDVTFNINVRDFKLEVPNYLGVTISENVKVNAKYYWEVK